MKLRIGACVMGFAMSLAAQGPPMEMLKNYLELTDTQVSQLQEIRKAEFTESREVMQTMRQKEQQLEKLRADGSTDATALGQLMVDIESGRKRMNGSHDGYRGQAVNVLTATQKTKLQALEEAAKLAPAIEQAAGMGLLRRPAPPAGGPRGPAVMRGPGGPGPGGPGPGGLGIPRPARRPLE